MNETVPTIDGAGESESGMDVVLGFNEALARGDMPGMLKFPRSGARVAGT